jgi:glycosyltransferase involved in cell wall biosynthesis
MEKISIIIPFYNCQFIQQAIRSALNQSYENKEIIVVNDGSSSEYSSLVQPFIKEITYIAKTNGGTASALNTGIKHATGDYFCWLSSDDLYHHEKLTKQMQFMKKKNAKIGYSSFLMINKEGNPITGPIGRSFNHKQFKSNLKSGCFINGCTVMMKMSVFKDIGYFDESLKYANDYDYWIRVAQKYKFQYMPQPLVYYRVHDTMGTKKYRKEIEKENKIVKKRHQAFLT